MADISAAQAGTITIGNLTVNRLGLGTNRINDNQQAQQILHRAVELDVNFIDTAHLYQSGESERMIGQTLAPYPAGGVIATKGGYDTNSPEIIRRQLEQSLHSLQLDQIPLYHLHRVHA